MSNHANTYRNVLNPLVLLFLTLLAISCATTADTPNKALRYAAMQGRTANVQAALSAGADVNERSLSGATPLHWAAKGGHLDTAGVLLRNGADINARENTTKYTPLHSAALEGQVEMVRFLAANGADLRLTDRNGYTPARAVMIRYTNCLKRFYPKHYSCRKLEPAVRALQELSK
jgi:ankyrin repeat protein